MDEIVKAIYKLKPGAQYSFTNEDYSTIKWDILEGVAPTQLEIDAAIEEIKNDEIIEKAKVLAEKTALLTKLGLTADEFKILLG